MPGRPSGMKYLDVRRLSFLAANPDLLEQMIEANLVICRNIAGAALGGVDEWAGQRMPRAVQRRVKLQVAVREFDASGGLAGNFGVMRNHHDSLPGLVQLPENLPSDCFLYSS